MENKKFIIKLDRAREVRWSHRADARADSLPRLSQAGGFYQLCAFVWAALVDRHHPFEDPEDLAPYLATEEAAAAASEVLLAARRHAREADEKNAGGSTPKPSPSSSSA